MSPVLDEGSMVHAKIISVRHKQKLLGAVPVIEFEVLDEGPHLGVHVIGRPERKLFDWMATILGYSRAFVETCCRIDRILNQPCRIVIGITGTLRPRCVVRDVLPV